MTEPETLPMFDVEPVGPRHVRPIAHTLVIEPDGDEDWKCTLTCPYKGMFDVPGRPCGIWAECDCRLTDDEYDALLDVKAGTCPTSPTGWHYDGATCTDELDGPVRPASGCWALSGWTSPYEAAEPVFAAHGHGAYLVAVEYDDGTRFCPLARIEGGRDGN